MTAAKDYALQAVASLARVLPPGTDTGKVTAAIELVLEAAAREHETVERRAPSGPCRLGWHSALA